MLSRLIVIIGFMLCVSSSSFAQEDQVAALSKTQMLINQDFHSHYFDDRKVEYLAKDKNVFIKYNPVTLIFGGALMFYQKVISQQSSSNCPYDLSCSEFGRTAISQFGFIKGIPLTADRLTRCTQFTLMDLDDTDFNKHGQIRDPLERYKFRHWDTPSCFLYFSWDLNQSLKILNRKLVLFNIWSQTSHMMTCCTISRMKCLKALIGDLLKTPCIITQAGLITLKSG